MTSTEPQRPTAGAGSQQPGNQFLKGPFAPVDQEITVHDLKVTGTIPAELNGRLLRVGPNPIDPEDPVTYNWFSGNGMVHGVRLRDGRAEWYRNRFVRDDQVTASRGWPKTPGRRPPPRVRPMWCGRRPTPTSSPRAATRSRSWRADSSPMS
ncbi:carotenoid oxygenase family protein [Streptomyces stelliscabiei]|uniref:carotenoid oxygenase family protein n=1 Tax=Streptomyces stelliscabiei TaxID=146820 RepID=UPI002FF390DB